VVEFFQKRCFSRFAALAIPASFLLDLFCGFLKEVQRHNLSVRPMKASSQFVPWNCSDSTRSILVQTSLDLASPRIFDSRI
jgi:hypothetical protein